MPSGIFKAPYQIQINYFKVQVGVDPTSSLNEMIVQRFQNLTGLSKTGVLTQSDLVWRRLHNLGYRGSLGEMLNNFFAVKTGIQDRVSAEIQFFSNTGNAFS